MVRVSKDGPRRDCPLIILQTATIELVLPVIASASEAIHDGARRNDLPLSFLRKQEPITTDVRGFETYLTLVPNEKPRRMGPGSRLLSLACPGRQRWIPI